MDNATPPPRSHSTESFSSPGQTTPTSSVGDGPVASPSKEPTLRLETENTFPRDDHVKQQHDSTTLNASPEEASARPIPVDPVRPVVVTQDSSAACTPLSQAPPAGCTTGAPAPSAPMSSLSVARQFGSPRPRKDEVLDMICIGFGPASLAIAIALADRCTAASPSLFPRVLFLEKQREFSWHAGMQLPDAHMQISFLKDLATPRDPTSPFSFLNYLHLKGRLQKFINLGTFLPARNEYEDYMRWCAEHFQDSVRYGCEATTVEHLTNTTTGLVDSFKVHWEDNSYANTNTTTGHALARHVIVATGGSPFVPPLFKPFTSGPFPRFLHSSQYATTIHSLERILAEPDAVLHELNAAIDELDPPTTTIALPPSLASEAISSMRLSSPSPPSPPPQLTPSETATLYAKIATLRNHHAALRTGLSSIGLHPLPLRFLVIGGGQSAAEIYTDLTTRFPSSSVHLLVKGSSLRPSDDSPFVNEIFDPNRVDSIYAQPATSRAAALTLDRATNYGVVRIDLLERMYAALYAQSIHEPDETKWRCRIISGRTVVSVSNAADGRSVEVVVVPTEDLEISRSAEAGVGAETKAREEKMHATMVFFATGYVRDAHERLLDGTRELLVDSGQGQSVKGFEVGRDYRVKYDSEKVDKRAGVWLQGCNEKTHGLSDTLLSILAHRGGEMVQSIFG